MKIDQLLCHNYYKSICNGLFYFATPYTWTFMSEKQIWFRYPIHCTICFSLSGKWLL